ncbi:MAG: hypothetical protein AB7K36_29915 [Chloroflexota bacterium]
MAITQSALAHAVARDFLRAAPPEAGIKRLWVWSQHGYIDPERDYVELTVFADPADEAAATRLSDAACRLNNLYPEANLAASFLGEHVPGGRTPDQWVRPDAEEIPLDNE